jgi:hypothetical protein
MQTMTETQTYFHQRSKSAAGRASRTIFWTAYGFVSRLTLKVKGGSVTPWVRLILISEE